jgi:2-haloacid dehalogenase
MHALLSFDVYGTLMNTPPANARAFRAILDAAGATDTDALAFYAFWEQRNIFHYREPYRSYKQICRLSLQEAFARFAIPAGDPDLIGHYFAAFPGMEPYADVKPTLDRLRETYRLAIVSNIDDDLLEATRLPVTFDIVCTAERARGYKPDGTLFRHLLAQCGLPPQQILHSGQSQFTDMPGAKPLGLTVAWINRRSLALSPEVPRPDHILPDIASLPRILG